MRRRGAGKGSILRLRPAPSSADNQLPVVLPSVAWTRLSNLVHHPPTLCLQLLLKRSARSHTCWRQFKELASNCLLPTIACLQAFLRLVCPAALAVLHVNASPSAPRLCAPALAAAGAQASACASVAAEQLLRIYRMPRLDLDSLDTQMQLLSACCSAAGACSLRKLVLTAPSLSFPSRRTAVCRQYAISN